MKCLFLAFFVLLPQYCSADRHPHPPLTHSVIPSLQADVRELKSDVARLKASNTKCESGVLDSGYCNPPTPACFSNTKTITFSLNFQDPPAVSFGFNHLDLSKEANIRVSTSKDGFQTALEVTKTTAKINFFCWSNSGCYRAFVSWMACGLVPI